MNKVAAAVCSQEGGKVNLPIAQVKEVISACVKVLKSFKMSEILELFERP